MEEILYDKDCPKINKVLDMLDTTLEAYSISSNPALVNVYNKIKEFKESIQSTRNFKEIDFDPTIDKLVTEEVIELRTIANEYKLREELRLKKEREFYDSNDPANIQPSESVGPETPTTVKDLKEFLNKFSDDMVVLNNTNVIGLSTNIITQVQELEMDDVVNDCSDEISEIIPDNYTHITDGNRVKVLILE